MEPTAQQLELLKKHVRIEDSYDDDILKEYYAWAYNDIVDAVTGEQLPDYEFFDNERLFNAALFPLTAYYYDNRLAFDSVTRDVTYAPHMVLSIVHKLRYRYSIR